MSEYLRFMLADDHAIVRRGLKQILLDEFPTSRIEEGEGAKSVLEVIKVKDFDLLICDISMPGINGLELCKQVKELRPSQSVLILSMHSEEQYAIRSLRAGASGYLTKDGAPEELIMAVRSILGGKKYVSSELASIMAKHISNSDQLELHELLSDRELEVLKNLSKGESLTAIGNKLHLSPNTISTYRSRILEKMKMTSNAELIKYAIEHKLK